MRSPIGISIVVPVYKVEPYLHRCVDSILSQTYTDFELILVDDGSPDRCGVICDEYAAKDSRIVVIHQENRGVSAARNNGIRHATGEYVTFVDSDDWVAPQYLEILYGNAHRYEVDISICNTTWVSSYDPMPRNVPYQTAIYDRRKAITEYGLHSFNKFVLIHGKLVKRKILLKHMFPEDKQVSEDMAVVYKWYYAANQIVDSDAPLYYYYQHAQSVTHMKFDRRKLQCLQVRAEMLHFLEQEGFPEVYRAFLHEYLYNSAWQYEQFRDTLQDAATAEQIRRNIRSHIRRNWRTYSITPKTDAYALNVAYPGIMKAYWLVDRARQLLRKEGLRATALRAVNKIRNRNKS